MADATEQPVDEPVPAEDAPRIRGLFADGKACKHCGGVHSRACPRVKRLVFQGENLVEVEFWPEGRWSDDHIIWPEDVPAADDPAAQ